jgi:hypothetical protein
MRVTLGGIVSWLAGLLLLFFGLVGLLLSPVGGLLVVAAGAFALPPIRRRLLERLDVEMSRWVVLGVVLIIGFAGIATMGSSVDTPPPAGESNGGGGAAQGPTPTATATPTEEVLVHELGESFAVGSGDQSITYRVTDVFVQDRVGSSSFGAEPDGIFLVVILEMKNVGDESFDISDRHLRTVDEQDREFEADFEAAAYARSDPRINAEGITYEQLNPGLTATRAVVFDVSPGGEYRLKIAPVGVFSAADEHYVTLGSTSELRQSNG